MVINGREDGRQLDTPSISVNHKITFHFVADKSMREKEGERIVAEMCINKTKVALIHGLRNVKCIHKVPWLPSP